MKIQPLQNYLLVRMHDVPTESNIELPDAVKLEPYGIVCAVGPDCKFTKIGDKVMFHPSSMIGFDKGGDERILISEGSIYANVEPDQDQEGNAIPNN